MQFYLFQLFLTYFTALSIFLSHICFHSLTLNTFLLTFLHTLLSFSLYLLQLSRKVTPSTSYSVLFNQCSTFSILCCFNAYFNSLVSSTSNIQSFRTYSTCSLLLDRPQSVTLRLLQGDGLMIHPISVGCNEQPCINPIIWIKFF
jgi:hypothetical protein